MSKEITILVVDDQYEKIKLLSNIISSFDGVNFESKNCSHEALRYMRKNAVDILIIDMQIPESLGDDIDPMGGIKLLEYVTLSLPENRPKHILGITQYQDDDNLDRCERIFEDNGWLLISGVNGSDEKNIKTILRKKIEFIKSNSKRFDIAIVVALDEVELKSILELPVNFTIFSFPDDCHTYYTGTLKSVNGIEISIVVTSCLEMGLSHAASLGMKVSINFKPDYVIMTGICAGIKGRVGIGDIVVADSCWDWGSGKKTLLKGKSVFLPAPDQLKLDSGMKNQFKQIARNRTYLDQIYSKWPGNKPDKTLRLHVGPMATGAAVLQDVNIVESISSHNRETLAIDMEAYGLMTSVEMSSNTPPRFLVVKSISDFADDEKNDNWQNYAAFTSSNLILEYIRNHLYL